MPARGSPIADIPATAANPSISRRAPGRPARLAFQMGTRDVDLAYSPGSPEIGVKVDRDRASQLGLPLVAVARTVRTSLEGDIAGVFREDQEDIDIRVRLREEDRSDVQRIASLRL